MFAELVFLYCLVCNEPSYSLDQHSPELQHEVRLEVRQDFVVNSSDRLYFSLRPYLKGSAHDSVEATGLHAEVGFQFDEMVTVFLEHHSSHRADRESESLEYDAVGVRIRLQ